MYLTRPPLSPRWAEMAGNRVTISQGMISIVADTTVDDAQFAPQESWALPQNPLNPPMLVLTKETPAQSGTQAVRVTLVLGQLPGTAAVEWALEYTSYQVTEPVPLTWRVEPIATAVLLNFLLVASPASTCRFRLRATEPGKLPVRYPEQSIVTDGDPLYWSLIGIVSDGVLSKAEKGQVVAWWTAAVAEKPILDAMGIAAGTLTAKGAYDTCYTSLSDIAAMWAAPDDTDISTLSPTFYTRWSGYWAAKVALQGAVSAAIKDNTDLANLELGAIASDNMLSKGEKPVVNAQWISEQANFITLVNKAKAVVVPYGYYSDAYYVLSEVMDTTAVADYLTNTSIDGTAFLNAWVSYDSAKTRLLIALQSAVPAVAAATTTPTDLTGTGALLVDGATIADTEQVLLADEADHTTSGVYKNTVSSGTTTGSVYPASISGSTAAVTDLGNITDSALGTFGTLATLTEEALPVTESITVYGFVGTSNTGTLTFVVAAHPDNDSNLAFSKVKVDYSTDGGGIFNHMKWYMPTRLGAGETLGAGVSCTSAAGIDTLTVSLSGVSMSQLQIKVTCISAYKKVRTKTTYTDK